MRTPAMWLDRGKPISAKGMRRRMPGLQANSEGDTLKKRRLLDYESRHQPLLTRQAFARRLLLSTGLALALIAISLFAGMCGYHYYEGMDWIDAFANASMILSGMGPLAPLQTFAGKLFAGIYALYSGLALILAIGLIFAPIVHRIMHRFHLEED
jgi:hypothetical protein